MIRVLGRAICAIAGWGGNVINSAPESIQTSDWRESLRAPSHTTSVIYGRLIVATRLYRSAGGSARDNPPLS